MSNAYPYEPVIGLEVHIQLSTQSKAFCGDAAAFGGDPNTHVSAISLGYPGTLPRLNQRQVELALRLGLALGSDINRVTTFDRKNYFYADLPKGYQITQDRAPICVGGALPIRVEDEVKRVRIHHIHMEEDAGKSLHDQAPHVSLIDLNRAGVPLLEVVTEPDLRSAEEVDAFMSAMRQLVRWLGVSDGNMEEGSMRCDVNVSIRRQGDTRLGQRCEIKNVNSMRYARRAIDYEMQRQITLVESGGRVDQQTLNFDPVSGITTPLRDKEEAHDYRYFPEPDLPPVTLSEAEIEAVSSWLPELPWELYQRFLSRYELPDYDASLLTEERPVAEFFLSLASLTTNYKAAANLLINKIIPYCKEQRAAIDAFPVSLSHLASFIALIDEGKVSNTAAYQTLFSAMTEHPGRPPLALAEALNLLQTSDEGFLLELVTAVLHDYPDEVNTYRNGKKGLLGFFMGEVMRRSEGKADPKIANKLIREKLG